MPQKDVTDLILNDVERSVLQGFADNKTLVGAVKKVLLAAGYYNGTLRAGIEADPTRNAALILAFSGQASNEQIGQDIRALAEAVRLIETGFEKLTKFKSPPQPSKKGPNGAR